MLSRRLIIFLKAPVKGSVKTRLASQIGDDLALKAYQAMTADLRENLKEYEPITWYFFDDPAGASLLKSPVSGERIRRQAGHDIGEKMSNAFADVFREQVDLAVLVGSDIPYLDRALIDEFFLGSLSTHWFWDRLGTEDTISSDFNGDTLLLGCFKTSPGALQLSLRRPSKEPKNLPSRSTAAKCSRMSTLWRTYGPCCPTGRFRRGCPG